MAQSDALRYLGHYGESCALMDEAGRIFLSLGNEVGWARTRTGWLIAAHLLGRAAAALPEAERAEPILIRHQQWLRAAGLDLNRAIVCQALGHYDQALYLYDRALEFYERARQSDDSLRATAEIRAAKARANKAMLLTLRGDFQSALTLHEAAREVFVRHEQTLAVLREDQYIADVYAGRGQTTRALRLYNETFAALRQASLDVETAPVAIQMLECYLSLNRDTEALMFAKEAIARFEACGTPTEAAKARFYCALAQARLGDVPLALTLLDEATRTFAAAGLTSYLAIATLQRARLHLDEADWTATLAETERAHALFAAQGLVVRQAQTELVRARALLGLGRHAAAASLAHSAEAIARAHELLWLLHESHHILAKVAQARGEQAAALAEYRAAISSIEHTQGGLAPELRTYFLADKLQVYQDAIDHCLDLGQPEAAFDYLERAKSRAMVDYLASNLGVRLRARGAAAPALLDEFARLREEHNWFYNRLYGYGLARPADDTPSDPASETLRAAIQERETAMARLLERLALQQAAGLELLPVSPQGDALALPEIDARTVLLEYYFRPDGGAVFVRTHDGLVAVPLATTPTAIRRLLHQWQLNLDATAQALATGASLDGLGRNARGILAALYKALLQPVEPYLNGYDRLIAIPYGPTHAVPFHALHDGRRFLLEAWEVSACPSSSLLRLCRERPRSGTHDALILAHSDGGRLPQVVEEARAIAAILPGECYVEQQATRAVLQQAAPRHGILHLAAHGEARLDNPAFAHVKLADGQLNTVDVFNLPLDGALVTLSACESGRSVVAGGDELIGLSRGFLYAGAATLVQSLWRVEERSTAELMVAFYGALAAGQPKGAALRAAQLALREERGAHPYFWAPFQLIGDHGPLGGAPSSTERAPSGQRESR